MVKALTLLAMGVIMAIMITMLASKRTTQSLAYAIGSVPEIHVPDTADVRDREILNALCKTYPVYPKSNLRLAVSAACDARYTTKDTHK